MKTQTAKTTQTMQTERAAMKSASAKTEPSPSIQVRNTMFGRSLKKRLLTLSAALGLAAWGTGVANADNVLFNGTLDLVGLADQINQTPIGWTVAGTKTISGTFYDGGDSETFCNVLDPGGYGFFFKPFQGDVSAEDLLDVHLYQDNATTPGTTFTLSFYAAGEANYSGFFATNSPAPKTLAVIEFLDSSSSVVASNGYDLISAGLPNGGPGSMSSFLYTTPSVTAPANTVTVRAGAFMLNTYGTSGAQSFFVDAFDLEATPAAGSPVITNQPAQTTVAPGGTANFKVGVSNDAGVSYQWQFFHTNISNGGHISGATSQTLTITSASAGDVGHYRVHVSNGSGENYSTDASLALVDLNIFPVVLLTGKIGDTYRVDYSTALAPTTWIPLITNKLTTSPQLVVDTGSPRSNTRFYRAVFLY